MSLPQNEEHRPEVLSALLRAHPIASLVYQRAGRLHASQLALCSEGPVSAGKLALCGRVPAAHPIVQDIDHDLMVIFQGPQRYIGPAQEGEGQPWTHLAVHIHGTLRLHDDLAWLQQHLTRIAAGTSGAQQSVWQGCLGIEIRATRVLGIWSAAPGAAYTPTVGAPASAPATALRRYAT